MREIEESSSFQQSEVDVPDKRDSCFPDKSSFTKYKVPIALFLIGFYFLIFGIIELLTNYPENRVAQRMQCSTQFCQATLPYEPKYGKSIYIYIRNNAISNHDIERTIEIASAHSSISACPFPKKTNEQNSKQISITGIALNQDQESLPCGSFAALYPQGDFTITSVSDESMEFTVKTDDLTLLKDFEYSNQDITKQWADVSHGRYKSWNEANVGLGLVKYWGYVELATLGFTELNITLQVNNPFKNGFQKHLEILLSDNEAFTGFNLFACLFQISAAILMFLLGGVGCWKSGVRSSAQVKAPMETVKFGEIRESEAAEIINNTSAAFRRVGPSF